MKHLILGYGYCGYYLANELLATKNKVWTVSRTLNDSYKLKRVEHLIADVFSHDFHFDKAIDVLHYMIPPQGEGKEDLALKKFLSQSKIQTRKIIYYGSSGVYGDHQGQIVNEQAECFLKYDRQYRRLNAEQQLFDFGRNHNVIIGLLRIAGIYGPNRIPDKNVTNGVKVLKVSQAPWTNNIYVKDLVRVSNQIAKKIRKSSVFNISDGIPTPMGSSHRVLAILMGGHPVYEENLNEILHISSPLKREFLMSSKKISIDKLKTFLGGNLYFRDKVAGLKEALDHTPSH